MAADPWGFAADELERKVDTAIERLRHFEPEEGYSLAFSGGKDSIVLLDLAKRAGVRFEARYAVTTIDPPELVQFIRRYHPDVRWDHPARPFLRAMVDMRTPPLRTARWCCREYKERWGSGTVLLGIRWAESTRRSYRGMIEHCMAGGTAKHDREKLVSPIIDWSDDEVWGYIRSRDLPYCSLYDEGQKRIGCLFCPMQYFKRRLEQAERYPRITRLWIRAFEEMHAKRVADGRRVDQSTGEEWFWWWLAHEDEDRAGQVRQGIFQDA